MLTSVDAIVTALGGTTAVASLAGVSLPAVSNWKVRGRIPTDKFMIFDRALADRELRADPAVFGFDAAEARP